MSMFFIEAVGRHWKSLGHGVDGQLCLYPEEALFLLECNNLLITFGEVDMSLQVGTLLEYFWMIRMIFELICLDKNLVEYTSWPFASFLLVQFSIFTRHILPLNTQ